MLSNKNKVFYFFFSLTLSLFKHLQKSLLKLIKKETKKKEKDDSVSKISLHIILCELGTKCGKFRLR